MSDWLQQALDDSLNCFQASKDLILKTVPKAIEACVQTVEDDGIIYWIGNGGSAADSQHMAAELIGRFKKERRALKSLALTVNTSILTAIGNDYGYDRVFDRQLEAFGSPKDTIIAISTSGNSPNVVEALKTAKEKGITVISLTGETGGAMKEYSDILLNVPSKDTPRIQEVQLMIEHLICDGIEQAVVKNG